MCYRSSIPISPARPWRRASRLVSVVLGVGLLGAAGVAELSGQQPPRTPTDVCANDTCHADILRRPVMHQPAARLACLDCHEYAVPERHLFRLTAPQSDLCAGCHALRLDEKVHEPLATGNCTGCHDPHGSDHPHVLLDALNEGLCLRCHTQDFSQKAFVHGPVAIGACVICHDAHSSHQDHLLTNAPDRLCTGCHVEAIPTGAAARHQHKPMEDGCTTCHDPHASDVRFQLNESLPRLCLGCHEGVATQLASASMVHGPTGGERACVGCHSPHFSALPDLQRDVQPALCLDCHDEPLTATDGRPLENMAKLLAENPSQHGPIRDGGCTGCHDAHAGEQFSLLIEAYPPEFYAPFERQRYALCFSCHLVDLVLDESGTGLTRFRDDDRNLHWLHVNRQKGRTCRACHEVHASRRPFHIREAVPFGSGGWMLEIGFEQTDDGGTCTPGCHKTKAYARSAGGAAARAAASTPPAAGPE